MNESSGSISRANEGKKTEESWEQQWQAIPCLAPKIHNKSGPKPLMRNPFPFFPAQRPRYHAHITWLGQQTNRLGKKHPYYP
jgi:hypothetical protein